MINPTLLIGLGSLGTELAESNFEYLKSKYPMLNFVELITLNDSFISRGGEKTNFNFSKDTEPYKNNLETINQNIELIEDEISESINCLLDPGRFADSLEQISAQKVTVFVFFSLGDTIGSISIQSILNSLELSRFKNSLKNYLFAVDYEFQKEDSKERAYCCLSELDSYLSKTNIVKSVTVVSKYTLGNLFPISKKSDLLYLSNRFVGIVLNQNLDGVDSIINNPMLLQNRVNGKRTLYNSFGLASIYYSQVDIWNDFTLFEKQNYLEEVSSRIDNTDIPVAEINASVTQFVNKHTKDKLYQRLQTAEDGGSFKPNLLNSIQQQVAIEKPKSSFEFNGLVKRASSNFEENEWLKIQSNVSSNISIVYKSAIGSIEKDILSKLDVKGSGIAFARAVLKELLGEVDDSSDGIIIEKSKSLAFIDEDVLSYFKHQLYSKLPIKDRDDSLRDIITVDSLSNLRQKIRNTETSVEELIKNRSLIDDKITIDINDDFTEYEQGYFTINGRKLSINGCSSIDSEILTDLYSPTDSINSKVIDLRPYMSDLVENQGGIGSCVTNSITSIIEYISRRSTGNNYRMSRLFLYYNARVSDADLELSDTGCSIVKALKSAKEFGVCKEDLWPYIETHVNIKPSEDAYTQAGEVKVDVFQRIEPKLDHMLSCLQEGYPFVFGLKIFPSFQSSTGLISIPSNEEVSKVIHQSSHAMLCVGYNKVKKYFVVRNSWGDKWGDKGYCYIPFDYMTNNNFIHNVSTIRSMDETVNSLLKNNIEQTDLNFFKNGNDPLMRLQLLNVELASAEREHQDDIREYKDLFSKYNQQNKFFRNVNNRNTIKDTIIDTISKDEQLEKSKLVDNEKQINDLKSSFTLINQAEAKFLWKCAYITIGLFLLAVVISLATGTFVSLISAPFRAVLNDPILLLLPFKSYMFWIPVISITIVLSMWYNRYYVSRVTLKEQKGRLLSQKTYIQNSIIKIIDSRWNLSFDYFVNSHIYESVVKKIITYSEETLKDVNKFVESIHSFTAKNLNESFSNITSDLAFSKNLVTIKNDLSVYYSDKGSENLRLTHDKVSLESKMSEHFLNFKNKNMSFNEDVNSYFKTKNKKYLAKYTLSHLYDKDIFNVAAHIESNSDYLHNYSNPILDVSTSQMENKLEHTSIIFNSNDAFNPLSDILSGQLISPSHVQSENKNELVTFQFINSFPAYYINSVMMFHSRKDLSKYYIYEGVEEINPESN
jgi:C1A family cysteine protease